LAQKMPVGPCIPAGIQLEKAELGPTSGPTWRLSRLMGGSARAASVGRVCGPRPTVFCACLYGWRVYILHAPAQSRPRASDTRLLVPSRCVIQLLCNTKKKKIEALRASSKSTPICTSCMREQINKKHWTDHKSLTLVTIMNASRSWRGGSTHPPAYIRSCAVIAIATP
jgi:hypothetical protein